MNRWLDALGMKEYSSGFNKAFILKENNNVSDKEIKNIEKYLEGNGIVCNKVTYNGQIKFIYITEKYRILISVITQMEKSIFLKCLLQIIQCQCRIKASGKLDIRKVLIDKRYIYWDDETQQVKIIYIPVKNVDVSEEETRKNLGDFLKWMIQSVRILDSRTERDLILLLTNPDVKLEQIEEKVIDMLGNTAKTGSDLTGKNSKSKEEQLILQMINSEEEVVFKVPRKEFVIGRSVKSADGVVPQNVMIGRTHCKIKYIQNKYYLEDLDSKNGTFLNGEKILKNISKEIMANDIIRLANVEFVAKYME